MCTSNTNDAEKMSSNQFPDLVKAPDHTKEIIEVCKSDEEKEPLAQDTELKEGSDDIMTLDATTESSPIKRQRVNDGDFPKTNPFARFAHLNGFPSNKQDIVPRLNVAQNNNKIGKKKDKNDKEDPVRMDTLSPAEVENVKRKWYGFLQQNDPMEDQRFQLLVAARLHARCQDKAVHHAMIELRNSLLPLPFSAKTMAQADPSKLQERISNLQFYSVKAKQIVQAANEIVRQFDGEVPESESSLIQLTGIGPVFADLLATINTRAEHQKRRGDNLFKSD